MRADIDPVLDGLIRTLPRIYRDKDFEITRHGPTGLRFRGHPRDLEDMIGNLLDNAVKWTKDQVMVTLAEVDGNMSLTIEDNGPGLAPEQFAEAVKRGARLDEATPGTGFGLSIVNDLAEAYKGRFTLDRAAIGGLKAVLHLPVAKD